MHRGDALAILESLVGYRLHTRRNDDLGQTLASLEGFLTNRFQSRGENHLLKCLGTSEHTSGQFISLRLDGTFDVALDDGDACEVNAVDETLIGILSLGARHNLLKQLEIGTIQRAADLKIGDLETLIISDLGC